MCKLRSTAILSFQIPIPQLLCGDFFNSIDQTRSCGPCRLNVRFARNRTRPGDLRTIRRCPAERGVCAWYGLAMTRSLADNPGRWAVAVSPEDDWALLDELERAVPALSEKLKREPELSRDEAMAFCKAQTSVPGIHFRSCVTSSAPRAICWRAAA